MCTVLDPTVTEVQILNLALGGANSTYISRHSISLYPAYTGRPLELSSKSKESRINKIYVVFLVIICSQVGNILQVVPTEALPVPSASFSLPVPVQNPSNQQPVSNFLWV